MKRLLSILCAAALALTLAACANITPLPTAEPTPTPAPSAEPSAEPTAEPTPEPPETPEPTDPMELLDLMNGDDDDE